MTTIVWIIWAANIIVPAAAIFYIIRHKHYQKHPAFFACLVFFVVKSLILVSIYDSDHYAAVYYGAAFIAVFFRLAVAAEVLAAVFPHMQRHATNTCIGVLGLFCASLVASSMLGVGTFVQTTEAISLFLSASVFGFVWVYSGWFRKQADCQTFGVAVGFTFVTIIQAITANLSLSLGVYSRIPGMLAFTIGACVWTWHYKVPLPTRIRVDLKRVNNMRTTLHRQAHRLASG